MIGSEMNRRIRACVCIYSWVEFGHVVLVCASIYASNLYRVDEERRARGALDHGQGPSRKDGVDERRRRDCMLAPSGIAEAGLNMRL